MFDLSFAELALIVVVAVIFIGPKELPVVIKAAGKALRTMRSLSRELRSIFDEISRESGLEEAAKDISEITMIRGDDGKMYEAYNVSHLKPLPGAEPQKPEHAPASKVSDAPHD